MSNTDADWAKHPDIERLRRMTDGEIKDFLFTENTRLRAENARQRNEIDLGQHQYQLLFAESERRRSEIDRLRAENAELLWAACLFRDWCDDRRVVCDDVKKARDILVKTSKEDE